MNHSENTPTDSPADTQRDASLDQPESLDTLTQAAQVVLSMVKIQGPPTLTPLTGGKNNRVYRVDVPKGSLVLKVYFQHPKDTRDRMDAEFSFIKHVWNMGLRTLPQPVARLPLRQFALYTHLQGRPFAPGDVTREHVGQAAAFVHAINTRRDEFAGQNNTHSDLITEERPVIAHASDACFTLAHHLGSIEQRLSRLIALPANDKIDEEALAFVQGELTTAWKKNVATFRSQVQKNQMDLHQPVDEGDRVLSPSDFGFHNAIHQDDGSASFIDFEYAGWDDPAKLICDFFTQVAVPVPVEWMESFIDQFTACLHDAQDVRRRVEMLLPLYRVKWCAMTLGDFIPETADRRAFAKQQPTEQPEATQSNSHNEAHKETQLQKARQLLAAIN